MQAINAVFGLIGAVIMMLGVFVYIMEAIGIIRYKYVLNRMHVAGMGDTLGLFLCLAGLMFISGINFTTLKLALIIVFIYFASPTSSHLIAQLVARTDEEIKKHARVDVDDINAGANVTPGEAEEDSE